LCPDRSLVGAAVYVEHRAEVALVLLALVLVALVVGVGTLLVLP